MNYQDFYNTKIFLENMISGNHPNGNELIEAYKLLIEKKTQFEIELLKSNADMQKKWYEYDAELRKNMEGKA